jgi:hypothetical protein
MDHPRNLDEGEVWTATPTGIALDAIRVRFA